MATQLAPENAPRYGGAALSLLGVGFGAVDLTATAAIASALCATTGWTAGTSVQCLTPPPASAGRGVVILTVSNAVGTADPLLSFDGACALHAHARTPLLHAQARRSVRTNVLWLLIADANSGL